LFVASVWFYVGTTTPAALVLWFWYGLALTRRAQDPETG
jgi:hypothetical protein